MSPHPDAANNGERGIRFDTIEQVDTFLGALATELCKRMAKAKRSCRSLTLKVKLRHPDAPKEPSKHLGCGRVQTFSRSVAVSSWRQESIAADKDGLAQQVAGHMVRLFRALVPDDALVSDVRGLGVHATQLVVEESAERVSVGPDGINRTRRLIGAQTVAEPSEKPSSPEPAGGEHTHESPNARKKQTEECRTPTHVRVANKMNADGVSPSALPSPSQVDEGVLDALPEEIRREIKLGYVQREKRRKRQVKERPLGPGKQALPAKRPLLGVVVRHTKRKKTTEADPRGLQDREGANELLRDGTGPLNPEVLNALPEGLRKEILSEIARGLDPTKVRVSEKRTSATVPGNGVADHHLHRSVHRKARAQSLQKCFGETAAEWCEGMLGARSYEDARVILRANILRLKSGELEARNDAERAEVDSAWRSFQGRVRRDIAALVPVNLELAHRLLVFLRQGLAESEGHCCRSFFNAVLSAIQPIARDIWGGELHVDELGGD